MNNIFKFSENKPKTINQAFNLAKKRKQYSFLGLEKISFVKNTLGFFARFVSKISWEKTTFILSIILSVSSTIFFYQTGDIIAYGDAESHLNIAKRVVHGLTPGAAQLGGVWLPLPHILMIPFVYFDILWRTGLAGSIISGLSYIISAIFIYKLSNLLVKNNFLSFVSSFIFMSNPNILYMQSTPMTELVLIVFFVLNTFFFIKFLKKEGDIVSLMLAAFFGFCATLSRYDGWFLVLTEAVIIILYNFINKRPFKKLEGKLILFSTPAFYGILLWFAWNIMIFSNPLYFNKSEFSARSQQLAWMARNELPAAGNVVLSFAYYLVTSVANVGIIFFALGVLGLIYFLIKKGEKQKYFIFLVLVAPFIFHVTSLYLGQSIIFIPLLTPESFEWKLFNVRYGIMMVPVAALVIPYLFKNIFNKTKILTVFVLLLLFYFQFSLFSREKPSIITLSDGIVGLSSAKKVDAQDWLKENYDGGLVLLDDYARTMSIINTNIKMNDVIYIGTKPYWEESFEEPEKHATWIITQRDDQVWKNILENKTNEARLYKYFNKVYTSDEILIFKRMDN
ncbi:hypothetical protein KKA69_03430 [Patescibacteria group bacterium]|nr:hypothetical protein [Patescibacteria group bacterium]